jgi:arylsulfatase
LLTDDVGFASSSTFGGPVPTPALDRLAEGGLIYNRFHTTAFFGKHHNVPDEHSSAAGPFDLWPTGLGFEYFYGFIGGDTDPFFSFFTR